VGTVSVRQSRHSAARRLRWELMSLSGCFHSLAGKIADVVGWSELVSGDDGVTIILNGTMWVVYVLLATVHQQKTFVLHHVIITVALLV
jgi:hypothetical protein